jgi:hypothetical protein
MAGDGGFESMSHARRRTASATSSLRADSSRSSGEAAEKSASGSTADRRAPVKSECRKLKTGAGGNGMARPALVLAGALAALAVCAPAQAIETCFHTCLKGKMVSPDIDDQTIRDDMQACKSRCDEEEKAQLETDGIAAKVAACVPEKLPDADMKKVRSASPSVVAFANAFTWDVNNVLPDKIIRQVEITTQNLSLEDITMSAGGIVEPGKSGTFLIKYIADGYPSMRVTTRVKAIYACALEPPDPSKVPD